jgi:hypothetical protein
MYVYIYIYIHTDIFLYIYIYIYRHIFGNQRSQFEREFQRHDLRLIVTVQSGMIFSSVKTLCLRSRI